MENMCSLGVGVSRTANHFHATLATFQHFLPFSHHHSKGLKYPVLLFVLIRYEWTSCLMKAFLFTIWSLLMEVDTFVCFDILEKISKSSGGGAWKTGTTNGELDLSTESSTITTTSLLNISTSASFSPSDSQCGIFLLNLGSRKVVYTISFPNALNTDSNLWSSCCFSESNFQQYI